MKSRGSCTQFTPALKLCASPPFPDAVQLTSSRNCHFTCSVVCGAFWLAPDVTPFGKVRLGRGLLPGIALLKLAYWTMSSFSFARPKTQLSFALIELYVLVLVDQLDRATRSPAPIGEEVVSRP